MQKEWRMGLIVPIWKSIGYVRDPGKYSGLTLLSQVLKLLERVLDARIRRRVEGDFGENSEGPGRGEEQHTGCIRPERDGREDTGGTWQYGSGVR